MATKTIIKLRRDTLSNYAKPAAWSHIPEKGEVCIVDAVSGIRVKIGDGVKTFGNLPYADSKVIQGYYDNGKFYVEYSHTTEIPGEKNILYVDLHSNVIYYWNGALFVSNKADVPNATAETAGVMKLYTVHGQNEDGTMTQKAITDAISAIVFDIDEADGDGEKALTLDKPW